MTTAGARRRHRPSRRVSALAGSALLAVTLAACGSARVSEQTPAEVPNIQAPATVTTTIAATPPVNATGGTGDSSSGSDTTTDTSTNTTTDTAPAVNTTTGGVTTDTTPAGGATTTGTGTQTGTGGGGSALGGASAPPAGGTTGTT